MESVREDQLARALRWSLFGHGAIALFIVLKSLVFPGEPIRIAPALRVDMVGLPDLLKKDLSQVSKALPKMEEKPAEPVKEAKVAPPVKTEVAKPDELVLNPKKTKDKPADKIEEKVKEKTQEKKLKSALARIRALERLKDKNEEDEESDEAVIIKGNQASKGTSLTGDAKESAQAGYYDLIRESLVEYWTLPPWLGRQKLAAQVQVRIDPAGRVLSSHFVKNSGSPQFDEADLATIRDAQPLPRPPKELQELLSNNGVLVGFPL